MEEEKPKYVGRGGWRGGGRPKILDEDKLRKNNTLRATKEEWEIIKAIAKAVKHEPDKIPEIMTIVNRK